ncbi:MAG: bifunctional metallophosphatase/5'-nucleotidase [Chloroflexota bacterium]|nr:bifunctional metallophosphatase/5'-nucleotidase [Chloroflexota bacterium]
MTRFSRLRRVIALMSALALLLTMSAPTALAKDPSPKPPVEVQILGLNDFHGQLEVVNPIASSSGRIGSLQGSFPNQTCNPDGTPNCIPAGGVEYLATHVRTLRATNPDNTVFVSAGDLIGATPLLSALFHDEPTIEAFNLMDLDYNGVGNHEFDEGVNELLRMRYGDEPGRRYTPTPDGCHPVDGCGDGDGFDGAEFEFLAANVTYKDNGQTIFPPYAIHEFAGGTKVAFVGMTLEGTPLIVSPGGIASVDFLDEAESVNALVPHLKRRGVEAIVVLLHEGGSVPASGNGAGNVSAINQCVGATGPIPSIVPMMDEEIDVVITGHTNWAVNCNIDGKIVTGAAAQGRLVTDIDAEVDPATGDFVPGSFTVNNRIVTQDVAKAGDLTSLVAEYNVFAAPIAAVEVGETTAAMDRAVVTSGRESTLGRLIADAQLESSLGEGAQIAFMNPGGIRANLDAGPITHGEAFAVQPFSNIVTTKTFTGAQIERLLEQQFVTSAGGTRTLILQVSEGFTYTWDGSAAAAGNRVDPSTIKLDGVTIDPAGTYRVTMNNFLGDGGDDFPIFREGTDPATGDDDLVALEAYLGAHDPYTPMSVDRITRVN